MNVVGKARRPRLLQQILMYAQPWLLQTDGRTLTCKVASAVQDPANTQV